MRLKFLRNNTKGAALVENAIALPLFIFLIFGTIQFGQAIWAQAALQHGVEMAARCGGILALESADPPNPDPLPCSGASCPSTSACSISNPCTVQCYAAKQSLGLNPPVSTFTIPPNNTCTGGYLVTASYHFSFIEPIPITKITIRAQSCFPT